MGRWFEVYAFRLGAENSNRVAILFTDVSERRRQEEEMLNKNQQLTRINNDLDNFIYTASHDLKVPINNIEGLVNLLSKATDSTRPDAKVQNLLNLMQASINRFKETIKDLTEVAKVQSSAEEDQATLELADMLEEVKINIHTQIEEAQATITSDFSEAPTVNFSKKNLRSILYNLLSNAIKYRSPERPVHVHLSSTHPDAKHLLLSVRDNGLGIPEDDQAKVFTMFKRLHTHVDGTGIGLSIVKKIIDNQGGRIEIASTVGEGTTFSVYLKQ
jgi:signal transduction histidine kinase